MNNDSDEEFHEAISSGDILRAHTRTRHLAHFYEQRGEQTRASLWRERLCNSLCQLGRLEESARHAEQAIELAADPCCRARLLITLAYARIESFEYSDALIALGRAEEIARHYNEDVYVRAKTRGLKALTFERLLDNDRAAVSYEDAVRTLRLDGDVLSQSGSHLFNNFGYFLAHNKRHDEAEKYLLFSLELTKGRRNLHTEAVSKDSLGYLYTLTQRYADAEVLLQTSAKVFEAIPDRTQLIVTLLHLSELHERMRLYEAARAEAERALMLATETRRERQALMARQLLLNIKSPAPRPTGMRFTYRGLIYASKEMAAVVERIKVIARTDENVLLSGETGTGKELLAHAVHMESGRRESPFTPFNCSAVSRDLIESRLFGHRRGAFTGATHDERGIIRAAAGGTLFLDEIGSLGLEAQGALLRFLQSGEIQPVGASKPMTVDVRVVAATNHSLWADVEAGRFRKDLYFRLSVALISVPALRQRRGDVIPLAEEFARRYAAQYGLPEPTLSKGELDRLTEHDWPGNVRELENYIKRRVLFGVGETEIGAPGERLDSWRGLGASEKLNRLDEALERNKGNVTVTAKQLGISRRTIQKLLRKRDRGAA